MEQPTNQIQIQIKLSRYKQQKQTKNKKFRCNSSLSNNYKMLIFLMGTIAVHSDAKGGFKLTRPSDRKTLWTLHKR